MKLINKNFSKLYMQIHESKGRINKGIMYSYESKDFLYDIFIPDNTLLKKRYFKNTWSLFATDKSPVHKAIEQHYNI